MTPEFLNQLKRGSNVVEEMDISVQSAATLFFARHVEALLREFATHNRSSWNDYEYWTIFNCNPDGAHRLVSVFIGWMMQRDTTIEKIWIAVGGEGILWNSDLIRTAKRGEALELLSRLRSLVELASQRANEGILYSFDVVTRMDASQPVLPLRALSLGESLLVSIPRDVDADKLGWAIIQAWPC